jgi:hypothetical protein
MIVGECRVSKYEGEVRISPIQSGPGQVRSSRVEMVDGFPAGIAEWMEEVREVGRWVGNICVNVVGR